MADPAEPTVLIVPGLRDHVEMHWQTLLATHLPRVRTVPPMGRSDLDCQTRVKAIESQMAAITGPVVIVAHSGGCIMVAHWAAVTRHAQRVWGCLLATPPDFERPMPEGYPTIPMLQAGGWLPVPRSRLPFRSLVAVSRNDPLGEFNRVKALADQWGGEFEDLGEVGHLNPASGFGSWPRAQQLIAAMSSPLQPGGQAMSAI